MIAMRPRRLRRILALVASGGVLAAVGLAFLFAPEARATSSAVMVEPAYAVASAASVAGQVLVMVIISGVIAVCLIVAALRVVDAVLEWVQPVRRWLR